MHTLYDSEHFVVLHTWADAEPAPGEHSAMGTTNLPALPRQGFEIVDKRSGRELYLDGSWAELFQRHLAVWQHSSPTQDEVEETLSQYAELANIPLYVH